MTTRKKKPFWTKLLSALLVASMLVGTAGTSSFAAGDPQQKTEAGATVSDDSAGDNEDTAEKAAADTVEEDASAFDGADTSASKAELPKESGDDTLSNTDGTQAGTPEVIGGVTSDMPDTSDTDTEQTDPAAPDNDEADTAQVTDSSEDAEEVAPAYATIEEFLAAVAAVGEVDTQEDLLAAIDNCLSIYDRLSPEDQAAQTEMYEYIVGYREEVAAGNPDAGIEELVYTSYTSHIIFYPGDATPTGTKLKVGDCINGHWYVESISTSSVKFGSPYGEHNNGFKIPAPEMIWTGVTSDYKTYVRGTSFTGEPKVGSNPIIIYTGGENTYYNVQSTGTAPENPDNPSVPAGPYVKVVHQYYTGGTKNGEVTEYQAVTAPNYNVPKTIYPSDIKTRKPSYGGNTYSYKSMSSEPATVKVSKGASGQQGVFYLKYERTVATTNYTYQLTWDYNGGMVGNDNSRTKEEITQRGTHTFYEDAGGYGSPRPEKAGYTFKGWTYDGNGSYIDSNGQINMTGVANGTVSGTLTAVWESKEVKPREFTLEKVFEGLDEIPENFSMTVDVVCGELRTSKTLDLNNAESIDEDNLTVTWKAPYYYDQGNSNIIKVTEHGDVDGYTYTAKASSGSVNGNVITLNIAAMFSGGTRTITNTYIESGSTDPDTITVIWKDGYTDTPIKVETVDKNIEDEELKELYPDDPTREGYEFDGWGEPETDEDGNITITATWKPLDPTDETTTLEVTKTADKKEVKAGDTIQYKIEVKNSGSVKAKDVKVTDKLDTGKLEFESWSLNGGELKTTKPADDCYMIGDIEAGKTAILVITARVKDSVSTGTKINNAATADYTNKPEDAPNPEDKVTVTVVSDYMPTTLEVKKEADKQKVAAGEEIEYTITVTNKGANEAKDVIVADKLPEELELVSARIGDEEAEKNDAGAYIIGSLPAGQKAELVITAKVKGEVAVGTVIKNVATAEYVNKPEDETDPKDEVTVEVVDKDEADRKITIWYVDEDGNVLKEQVITEDPKSGDSYKKDVDYDVTTRVENEFTDEEGNNYVKNGDPDVALTGTMRDKDILIKVPYALKDTEPENPTNPTNPIDPADPTDPTPTPPGGGGGGGNGGGSDPDPTPTPGPATPTPGPTPIIPGPVPTVGPTPVVPTVTPVAATPAAPTPTAALVSPTPEAVELADEAVPLAAEEDKQPELEAVDEEETPLAGGKGAAWALINFALMNLAIFESVMLLIGYFVKTKNDDEEEKRKLKKKGIFRIISLPVAIISLIAFILTEDITLPTAFVDKYTIVMLIIAIVQTVMVALSNKKYEDEQEV